MQLDGIKTYQTTFTDKNCNNIANIFADISNTIEKLILVTLNLFNEHAVGLIFIKNDDTNVITQVKYIDSLNKPIPQELNQLLVDCSNIKINLQEISVEQQKYANCGPEVIENFIFYLTGARVSQEQAIELHSKLIENTLLNINVSDVHLLFDQQCNSCEPTHFEQSESEYMYELSYNNGHDVHQLDLLGSINLI